MWRSLVARLVWDQEVGGSNPLTPNINKRYMIMNRTEIKEAILSIQKRKQNAKQKFNKTIENLEKEQQKIINACNHTHHKFTSDPSGNNDSYSTCDDCGKEAKKL